MAHFQRPCFDWGDCKDPDLLALTAATQLPPDRPVAHHSSITEPSWLPRQNSFNSGYYSDEDSKLGPSEFTDDDHLSPVNAPEAAVNLQPDIARPSEAPMTLRQMLTLLGRRARASTNSLL